MDSWIDAAGNMLLVAWRPCVPGGCDRPFEELYRRRDAAALRPDLFAVLYRRRACYGMEFRNADGTPEDMCINALRAAIVVLRHQKEVQSLRCRVRTPCGEYTTFQRDADSSGVSVSLHNVVVELVSATEAVIDPGTPHRVLRVADTSAAGVEREGYRLSTGCEPVNATFVAAAGFGLRLRTFERGAGETGSCGSGALAGYLLAGTDTQSRMPAAPGTTRTVAQFRSGERLILERSEEEPGTIHIVGRCQILRSWPSASLGGESG